MTVFVGVFFNFKNQSLFLLFAMKINSGGDQTCPYLPTDFINTKNIHKYSKELKFAGVGGARGATAAGAYCVNNWEQWL